MPPTTIRESLIGYKIEAAEGTEEVLAASDFQIGAEGDGDSFAVTEHERPRRNGTFSKLNALGGPRRMSINFMQELAGGATGTAPKWGDAVRACGFAQSQLKYIPIGSITNGPFQFGELIGNASTIATSTALGRFVRLLSGPSRIVYVPVLGTFGASGTVNAFRSPQTSTAWTGSPTNAGWGYTPLSTTSAGGPPSLTLERRSNQQRRTLVGGRGSFSLTFKFGEAVMGDFRFEGAPVFASGTWPAQPWRNVSTLAIGTLLAPPQPPVVGGMGFPFLVDAYSPIATEVKLAVENTIAARPTIGSNDLVGSGYMSPMIMDRNVKASFDPENPPIASFDFAQRFISRATFPFAVEAGTPGGTAGLIVAGGQNCQFSGDALALGDRDGVEIVNAEGRLAGGLSGYGADDEFVLALITV
jgi:hypothetical protein